MVRKSGSYNGGSTIIGPRSADWFTSGSTTSSSKKLGKKKRKPTPAAANSKLAVSVKKVALLSVGPTNAGLTIPEMTNRAEKIVNRIQGEITLAERRLTKLRQELALAVKIRAEIDITPRRSAIGIALQKAKIAKPAD